MAPRLWLVVSLLVSLLTSCVTPGTGSGQETMELAEFTESYVHVSLVLELEGQGEAYLRATFTPTELDAHLYSKDLPKDGIDGLGRPTLIELPVGSQMQSAGVLQESLPAELDTISADQPALPVYPVGPVTLTLPVHLPVSGSTLVDDQVLISYMACNSYGCHKPVIEKLVDVQVPAK